MADMNHFWIIQEWRENVIQDAATSSYPLEDESTAKAKWIHSEKTFKESIYMNFKTGL